MPLKPGASKAVILSNIREMDRAGHPHRQSVAAAMRSAYGPRRDDGGGITGPLLGDTDGRADDIKTDVPDGAHIIPADVVSALGDGNSVAGSAKLGRMFPNSVKPKAARMGKLKPPAMPRPIRIPHLAGSPHIPRLPGFQHFAGGGKAKKVPVQLSDGEFRVHPLDVARVGGGDVERGHRALNEWIIQTRKQDIERRKHLPGPV